jgi:hypothetical protein
MVKGGEGCQKGLPRDLGEFPRCHRVPPEHPTSSQPTTHYLNYNVGLTLSVNPGDTLRWLSGLLVSVGKVTNQWPYSLQIISNLPTSYNRRRPTLRPPHLLLYPGALSA